MKKLIVMLVMSSWLFGCAGLTDFVSSDPDTAVLTSQIAAWKYIERKDGVGNRSQQAVQVKRFADDGLEALEKNESVLIGEFATFLSSQIETPEISDRAVAELLIGRIADRLEEWADRQGLIGDERKVAVKTVLRAVSEAAEVYIQPEPVGA